MFVSRSALAALAAFAAMATIPTVAAAKVFPIPENNPVATLNVPDGWEPSTFDKGVEMTSPDGGIYLSVEEVDGSDISAAVVDTVKTLGDQGLKVDESTKKATDFEANGIKFHDFAYKGTDKDGPTNFDLTLAETGQDGKFVMMSYWGSDAADKANTDALTKIAQSLQITK